MADNSLKESGGAGATVTGREGSARVQTDENGLPLLMHGQVPGITRVRRRARMTEAARKKPAAAEAESFATAELDGDGVPLLADGQVPGLTRVRKQTEMTAAAPRELADVPAAFDIAKEVSGDELLATVQAAASRTGTEEEVAGPEPDPEDGPSEVASEDDEPRAGDAQDEEIHETVEIEMDELGYSTDRGQFLTSEELQSLSDVLGDPPDMSEELYADRALMDSSSLGWTSVQSELRGLRDTIQDLRQSSSDLDALKPMLVAIKDEVEVGHDRGEALTSSINSLTGDMRQIHQNLQSASDSAVESAKSVKVIHDQVIRHPVVAAVRDHVAMERPLVLAGVAVLLLSWAAAFYLKTGDLGLTLFGLVAANLASCAAILISRTGKLF